MLEHNKEIEVHLMHRSHLLFTHIVFYSGEGANRHVCLKEPRCHDACTFSTF